MMQMVQDSSDCKQHERQAADAPTVTATAAATDVAEYDLVSLLLQRLQQLHLTFSEAVAATVTTGIAAAAVAAVVHPHCVCVSFLHVCCRPSTSWTPL